MVSLYSLFFFKIGLASYSHRNDDEKQQAYE